MCKKKSLKEVLEEIEKYGGGSYQRVVIWVDDLDHYFDTTPSGAHVAMGDLSKFMVEDINNDNATEKWLPVLIYCKSLD